MPQKALVNLFTLLFRYERNNGNSELFMNFELAFRIEGFSQINSSFAKRERIINCILM